MRGISMSRVRTSGVRVRILSRAMKGSGCSSHDFQILFRRQGVGQQLSDNRRIVDNQDPDFPAGEFLIRVRARVPLLLSPFRRRYTRIEMATGPSAN